MLANATRWNKEKTKVGEEGEKEQGEEGHPGHGEEEGHQLRTPTGPIQLLQVLVLILNVLSQLC